MQKQVELMFITYCFTKHHEWHKKIYTIDPTTIRTFTSFKNQIKFYETIAFPKKYLYL